MEVDFCGEIISVQQSQTLSIGRDADLVVDADNAFLHRRIVELRHERDFWWVVNVGSRLSVTISGEVGTLHTQLGPGTSMPVVLPTVAVLFSAGDTTYEVLLHHAGAGFETTAPRLDPDGTMTLGAVDLTSSQFLMVLALAEPTLRRAGSGAAHIPSNAAAAERLTWSQTTFNRKLDNVCEKFARAGVKGLHGAPGRLATQRRARLVEYAVAARLVRPEHLSMLDRPAEVAR